MLGMLDEIGYQQTDDKRIADLMILNTCAIRENAEDKLYSYLGVWREIKAANPNGALIAVGGCVAQHEGERMVKRYPYIDIIFGTHNLHRLPELVLKAKETGRHVVETFQELPEDLPDLPVIRQNDYSAWVSVIYGCDYNCTYCIVPFVRGRERSRTPDELMKEIRELGVAGYKEVTLLGQNVTAYGHDLDPPMHLGNLIEMTAEIDSIKRIRFITGHPRDLKTEIIDSVAKTPKACNYFHIPIQAGDDRTLRRMARGYTVDFYRKRIDEIRSRIPDAAITSDLIVGFPGETEEEFLNTVRLVEEIEFDACNTAAYSPRPHTHSASWGEQIPDEIKRERIRLLNTVVGEVSHKVNQRYLNKTVEVLVEGPSARNPERLAGRTESNKIINFEGPKELTGQFTNVLVETANPWALRGRLV